MSTGTIKQILLITDGCSNQGESPASVAALAEQQGIAVNVIGILEDQENEAATQGLSEVEEIALSGGGVSQIVYAESLSQTVQMVTKQAMTQTLQGVVNQELKHILGSKETMEDLPPEQRGEVMEVVEDLGERCGLEVLVLIDTSASMGNKLPTVQEALIDLSISLNARSGDNRFSIFSFPGKRKDLDKVMDWTPRLDSISSVFPKLATRGITPTGPAIREALKQFTKKRGLRGFLAKEETPHEQQWD
ncbi:hypothetical protein N781_08455 [Pontibacillus halophilus JSM 076056 = DSM 19796]|uniref:VWFA domain-containing protein n=1 Tax=Pontibacillus halophilus JSM 076056 = DSM 19796 TaxID=1385510 RepID=A0A0A5GFT4_9BACI|nr:hypothetical protein N781_08455 [Pontibacillus halophilus JSM 076056 = DSM 19796]